MKYDPNRHHRRSLRLKGYNYFTPGAYFVTICVQNRECLFGKVINGQMILNEAGLMVEKIWLEIPIFYPGSNVDAFQVMPNHFHGIILVGTGRTSPMGAGLIGGGSIGGGSIGAGHVGAGPCACPVLDKQNDKEKTEKEAGQPQGVAPTTNSPTNPITTASQTVLENTSKRSGWLSLPEVVHRFKTMTTTRYIDGVKRQGWRPFNKRLWQRNYYEHIIRNPLALGRIRQYILLNPVKWQGDIVHPLIHDDPDVYYQQLFKRWEEGRLALKGRFH